MSYALYDDNLPSNRKVAWLRSQGVRGIAALGLHVLANTWCRHEGMQGFVPAYVPEQLVGRDWRKLVALLSDEDGCGMFIAVVGGWMINGYDEYGRDDGRSADDRKADLSRKRSEAGRRGGLAKAKQHPGKRSGKPDDLLDAKAGGNSDTTRSKDAKTNRRHDTETPSSPRENSANTGGPSSKPDDLPVANGQQNASPTPIPTVASTSEGSRNVPAGALANVIRCYVTEGRAAGVPTPEQSQAKVERSARSLLAQGYDLAAVLDAARNAAVGGWTDLATQLQRDAARASPATNGTTTSTADARFQHGLDVADQLERKALG